mgnify:CR=1 FL=1
MTRSIALLSAFLILFVSCTDEISQWRGPDRDGIYPDKGLLKAWPEEGPELIMSIDDIGGGLSQAVVYKEVIMMEDH